MGSVAARGLSYKSAGVDIDAGNELVRRIQKLNPNIGGFSGMVPFGALNGCCWEGCNTCGSGGSDLVPPCSARDVGLVARLWELKCVRRMLECVIICQGVGIC